HDSAHSLCLSHETTLIHMTTLSLHDALPISINVCTFSINTWIDEVLPTRSETLTTITFMPLPRTTFAPLASGRPSRASGTNGDPDRKSTRLNSSHVKSSYAVICLKNKKTR